MKFLHTADLHIGKKLYEQSLLEDQKEILEQIKRIALAQKVDAIVLAGDLYDRSVPATEAVELMDDFLTFFIREKIPVLAVSGNHDSPERVAFADRILEKQGLHIAGCVSEQLKEVVLEKDGERVHFVLLPFVKPAKTGNTTLQACVEELLSRHPMTACEGDTYCLITHYFVVGSNGEMPILSESETDVNVGGLDAVSQALFHSFTYVALGHIHRYQKIGEGNVYYSGSPLKYSFSEAAFDKSVNVVEIKDGSCHVERAFLTPLHEVRCIKGKLDDLLNARIQGEADFDCEDYLQVTLTDTEELIDPIGVLRSVYPNVLQLRFERKQGTDFENVLTDEGIQKESVEDLFGGFYEMLKGEAMDEKRQSIVREICKKVKEDRS